MTALDQIKVVSPCHADWEAMTGTTQIRFCGQCRKNVYNLSEMTRAGAQEIVERHEGRLCVRFYTRADGTMLTQDCPVGLRAARYRRARKFSYAAAVLLACGAGLLRDAGAATTRKHPVPAVKHSTKPVKQRSATFNPSVGPDPFAPHRRQTMGLISLPLMGKVRPPEMGYGAPAPK